MQPWGRFARIATAVLLVALVAYSARQRWQALSVSPFPLGVDGYFYPIQVRSLLEHGTLQYPTSPLTFWFMAPFAALTDPITGAKLGAAIGGALIALPAYGLGLRLGRSRGGGFAAAVIASMPAASQYLSTEFVKQGIGLTVALAALWLVLRAIDERSRGRIIAAVAGVIAVLLTHKLAAAFVIATAVPAIIEDARARGALRGRRLLYLLVTGGVLAIVFVVLGLVAPERFVGAHDLALAKNLLHRHAEWRLPALALPRYQLVYGHEALIGLMCAIGAIGTLVWKAYDRKQASLRVVAYVAIGLALLIALPWLAVDDPQGLAYRLRLAAFVPAALCGAIVVGALDALLAHVLQSIAVVRASLARDALFAALAAAAALIMPVDRAEGRVLTHPALVSAAMAAADQIPSNATVIIPERHILFMVAWYTRAKVSLRPDDVPYPQRVRLMPLAFIGMDSPLDHALDDARKEPTLEPPLGFHPRHRNGLVLVREPTWDWMLAHLGDAGRYWSKWPTI